MDNVNHPQHYQSEKGIEVIDVTDAFDLDFCLGNAVKYILRAGKKSTETEIEDLRKAVWYINHYIERVEPPLLKVDVN